MVMHLSILALVGLLPCGMAQEDCPGGSCLLPKQATKLETDTTILLQKQQILVRQGALEHTPVDPSWSTSRKRCVKSPAGFKRCWDAGKACCVDPDAGMFGSVMSYFEKKSETMKNRIYYPDTRSYAWAGGSDDLETVLRLRAKFGTTWMTTYGIQVTVGFNPIAASFTPVTETNPYGFQWIVFQAKRKYKHEIFAPTFAEWFRVFREKTGYAFDYDIVREILVAYNTLGPKEDVVDAWTKLTGCSRECSAPDVGTSITVTTECGCHQNVVRVYNELNDGGTESSFKCIKKLFLITKNKTTAGQVRAAFAACEDMLPVYTGFGLGYNTHVNPLKSCPQDCTHLPQDRLSGREFVMPNDKLEDLARSNFKTMPMLAIPSDANGDAILPENATSNFCL